MNNTPVSPKVTVALFAGAITTILAYLVEVFASVDIPTVVATAITTVIMGGIGYWKKDPLRDGPKH